MSATISIRDGFYNIVRSHRFPISATRGDQRNPEEIENDRHNIYSSRTFKYRVVFFFFISFYFFFFFFFLSIVWKSFARLVERRIESAIIKE